MYLNNEELKYYLLIVLVSIILITFNILGFNGGDLVFQ